MRDLEALGYVSEIDEQRRFYSFGLGLANADLAGTYRVLFELAGTSTTLEWEISPQGNNSTIHLSGRSFGYTFSENTLTCHIYYETVVKRYSDGHVYANIGQDAAITILFSNENGKITGSGTYIIQLLDEKQKPTQEPFSASVSLEKMK